MTSWRRWLVVGVAVVVVALLAGPPAGGRALDPESTAPSGARAVVELLGRLGAEVSVVERLDGASPDRILVLEDRLLPDVRAEIERRVRAGAVLVVADPSSPFAPPATGDGSRRDGVTLDCDLAALTGADEIVASVQALEVPDGATGCYRLDGGAWLVAAPLGRGAVVALGGAAPLLNANLDRADHAVVVAGLLAPDGAGRVAVVRPGAPGAGGGGLWSLVPTNVRAALVQLVVACVVFVIARSRRVGRPVRDDRPVHVEGAAVMMAAAGLHQRGGHDGAALATVLDGARRDLGRRLGLGADADLDDVADALGALGLDPAPLRIDPTSPRGGDDVVAAARSIASLRTDVLGGRT